MAYDKIRRFFAESFGIETAAATFVRAGLRLAQKAQPTLSGLRDQLVRTHCLHADETGWRVGGESAWLWVVASETITLFEIAASRGHEVVQTMLAGFGGILGCDGFAAYDPLDVLTLRCNGHVLRRISDLQETLSGVCDQRALRQVKDLFEEAADLKTRHERLTRRGYGRRVSETENRFDDWLELSQEACLPKRLRLHPDLIRLRNHLARHRENWFLYLYNPELPTTNNLAERQLRPGVITRKLGGCNKTWAGALKSATLGSLIATCRQQGRSFVALVHRLLHPRAPTAVALPTLPALS